MLADRNSVRKVKRLQTCLLGLWRGAVGSNMLETASASRSQLGAWQARVAGGDCLARWATSMDGEGGWDRWRVLSGPKHAGKASSGLVLEWGLLGPAQRGALARVVAWEISASANGGPSEGGKRVGRGSEGGGGAFVAQAPS